MNTKNIFRGLALFGALIVSVMFAGTAIAQSPLTSTLLEKLAADNIGVNWTDELDDGEPTGFCTGTFALTEPIEDYLDLPVGEVASVHFGDQLTIHGGNRYSIHNVPCPPPGATAHEPEPNAPASNPAGQSNEATIHYVWDDKLLVMEIIGAVILGLIGLIMGMYFHNKAAA